MSESSPPSPSPPTVPPAAPNLPGLPAEGPRPGHAQPGGGAAALVAAGIFLSRIAGFVRQRVFAHYLGTSGAADAFTAALRIPNFLQNLFGEGVLSASFIPVYARLLEEKNEEEARRVAGAVASLLALAMTLLVAIGVAGAPLLVDLLAPGFDGARREATVHLVRILFPGIGLLVMSAWCLGVLNSHRRFFLSYVAPVLWNAAIIAALIAGGGRPLYEVAVWAAWGAVAGSALQLGLQLPAVLVLLRGLRLSLGTASSHVRQVVVNFLPAMFTRGVVQFSIFVDEILASFLPTGAVAIVAYAQTLYTLPVSLFGMAVSASELPEMSRAIGAEDEVARTLRTRLERGLARIAFFVVPSAVAFLALGDVIASLVFQTGAFDREEALLVWRVLGGSSVGLLAATMARLYSSAFFALRDTRTPFRFAVVRVALAAALAWFLALHAPALLGIDPAWGIAGLTLASSLAGWVELSLLRRALHRRIGRTGLRPGPTAAMFGAALLAAAAGWGAKLLLLDRDLPPLLWSTAVIAAFGVVYLGITTAAGIGEGRALLKRILRR